MIDLREHVLPIVYDARVIYGEVKLGGDLTRRFLWNFTLQKELCNNQMSNVSIYFTLNLRATVIVNTCIRIL